jgi:hypothetical protein
MQLEAAEAETANEAQKLKQQKESVRIVLFIVSEACLQSSTCVPVFGRASIPISGSPSCAFEYF